MRSMFESPFAGTNSPQAAKNPKSKGRHVFPLAGDGVDHAGQLSRDAAHQLLFNSADGTSFAYNKALNNKDTLCNNIIIKH